MGLCPSLYRMKKKPTTTTINCKIFFIHNYSEHTAVRSAYHTHAANNAEQLQMWSKAHRQEMQMFVYV